MKVGRNVGTGRWD